MPTITAGLATTCRRGDIDWRRLLNILTFSGFHGISSLKLSGDHDRQPADYLREPCRARVFLEEISLSPA